MARTKNFDREEVLAQAMQTFLRHGYEGTSVQTLVEEMGINRGSLYDTFGDKRSLFLAAIAHYEENVIKNTFDVLNAPDADIQTIVDLFHRFVQTMAQEENCYGCLITNTAVELCPQDEEAKQLILSNFNQVVRGFKKVLNRAQKQGELDPDRDLDAIANYLTSSLQGLRVLGKVNRDPKTLKGIVDVILSVLH